MVDVVHRQRSRVEVPVEELKMMAIMKSTNNHVDGTRVQRWRKDSSLTTKIRVRRVTEF